MRRFSHLPLGPFATAFLALLVGCDGQTKNLVGEHWYRTAGSVSGRSSSSFVLADSVCAPLRIGADSVVSALRVDPAPAEHMGRRREESMRVFGRLLEEGDTIQATAVGLMGASYLFLEPDARWPDDSIEEVLGKLTFDLERGKHFVLDDRSATLLEVGESGFVLGVDTVFFRQLDCLLSLRADSLTTR